MKSLRNHISELKRSESGGVLILVSISILVLIVAAGLAVDVSRMQAAKVKLSTCLDTAGLAALAKVSSTPSTSTVTDWVDINVKKYFLADCQSGYLNTSAVSFNKPVGTVNNVIATLSPDFKNLTLNAVLTQQTKLMSVVGINQVIITGASVVTRSTSGLELALVLDNTGSMNAAVDPKTSPARKIDALKCALAGDAAFGGGTTCEKNNLVTTGLLDILYSGSNSVTNLYVGVVPFTDMVNLNVPAPPGINFVSNVTPANKGNMGGCVDSRDWTVASKTASNIIAPSGDKITLDISDDPPGAGTFFQGLLSSGNGDCPDAVVQPMSTLKSDAVASIKKMNASGSTMLPVGLGWGWRMLSPNWSGIWGATPTYTDPNKGTTIPLPLPYNTNNMLKVIVFMTDGMDNNGSSRDDVNTNGNNNNAYETQSQFPTNTKLDTLTKDVCDAMKSKGIIIYTIAFGKEATNSPPTNSDRNNLVLVDVPLLRYCASDANKAFLAPTNADLENAFQQIGAQLASLRVSQ